MLDDIHSTVCTSTRRLHRMELLDNFLTDMVLEEPGNFGCIYRKLCMVEASLGKIGGRCVHSLQSNADNTCFAPHTPDV